MVSRIGNYAKNKLRVKNSLIREFLSEFIGTFILIGVGCAVNAESVLINNKNIGVGHLSIALGWGWTMTMAAWISGGITGAQLNPAISVAMALLGRLNIAQMFVYWAAQYSGAFAGSACVYGIYSDALNNFDGGNRSVIGETATAGIWATYPQPFLSVRSGICDQIFGTFLLAVCAMALTDKFNMCPPGGMFPLCIGGVIATLNMTYTFNCGGAVNPARDFSPRLFTAIAGWGTEVFTVYDYWFWVPLVIPHFGAIFGALFYQLMVGIHAESEDEIEKQMIYLQEMKNIQYCKSLLSETQNQPEVSKDCEV